MDMTTAYFQGHLHKKIYIRPLEEIAEDDKKDKDWNKAMYGLKQGGRTWNKARKNLKSNELKIIQSRLMCLLQN